MATDAHGAAPRRTAAATASTAAAAAGPEIKPRAWGMRAAGERRWVGGGGGGGWGRVQGAVEVVTEFQLAGDVEVESFHCPGVNICV
jgi:hypothetical protein